MDYKDILIATLFLALGLSFAYKCIEAVFFGRTYYWAGWLPIGIASPFFIHWPPKKRSLIKRTQGWWIHITLGPAFFLCSLLFISTGMDKMGMNGTAMINTVLTMPFIPRRAGAPDEGPAITYSKAEGYKFPILPRMTKAIYNLMFASKVEMNENQVLDGQQDQATKGKVGTPTPTTPQK